jgi:DNA-binding MarR family transcriptional regulator
LPGADREIAREDLERLASRMYDSRRERARYFNDSLLGEPVWDMLLALYCSPARGKRLSVTSLCEAAGVPQTTASRWVQMLEDRGLIERQPDESDRRRHYLILAPRGEALMSAYLSSIFHKLQAP